MAQFDNLPILGRQDCHGYAYPVMIGMIIDIMVYCQTGEQRQLPSDDPLPQTLPMPIKEAVEGYPDNPGLGMLVVVGARLEHLRMRKKMQKNVLEAVIGFGRGHRSPHDAIDGWLLSQQQLIPSRTSL
jgi:hypothetical protein